MIKLVGFKVNKGSFVPDGQQKEVKFNSRVLGCLTDEGLNDSCFGYQYIEAKIKTDTLAQFFNCSNDDNTVNNYLGSMLHKNIQFQYAPINGNMVLVGIVNVEKK